MLSGVVARMLGRPGGGEVAAVGALLPALLSSLAEGIEAEHSAGRLLELAAQLTTGAPQALRPFLRQVRQGG
jgi:hypothetical protein